MGSYLWCLQFLPTQSVLILCPMHSDWRTCVRLSFFNWYFCLLSALGLRPYCYFCRSPGSRVEEIRRREVVWGCCSTELAECNCFLFSLLPTGRKLWSYETPSNKCKIRGDNFMSHFWDICPVKPLNIFFSISITSELCFRQWQL